MWTKKNILSKVSWKKIRSVYHFLLVILCVYIFYKGIGLYLDFIEFILPKPSILRPIIFSVPLILISFYDFKKHWRLSPFAFDVLKTIYTVILLLGWITFVQIITYTYF